LDMSPGAVTRRLQEVAALADLEPKRRFESKLDLTSAGITRRLRRVAELRRLCLALGRSAPTETGRST
jgi:hypothetical protein